MADLVERRLGLTFGPGDRDRLGQALSHRLPAHRDGFRYLDELETDCEAGNSVARDELAALASELTVGETYFLRQPDQFEVLAGTVLPDRMSRPDRPPVPARLLSAGCSGGEEAYSLAITLAEAGYKDAQITAIDVNPTALAKARTGRYTEWSMRAVPPPVQRRWFQAVGKHYEVDPDLRAYLDFRPANLVDPDPGLWRPTFDAIFCRNVMMYFSPPTMSEVVRRLASALMPGGYLFLGSAETLRGVSEEFDLRETNGTFYYQLAESPNGQGLSPVEAIAGPRPGRSRPAEPDRESFDQVLDLMRAERFGAALGAIEVVDVPTSPPATPWETEVVLVRAILLSHAGDLTAATRDAHRLLGRGLVSADAHAVLANCREADADTRGAVLHWRAAADADPRFALAHLHLGRLSRATGDRSGAGRAYDRAIDLLPSETDRRMLLFGGGFDRQALLSLCRTMSRHDRSLHGGEPG
ncbi:CheR family methyltransferase [Kineosporia sp. NBRC 101731]|uniref:CheR family methyltransferase n=1 Tax=Kineosporia sp. NBRC 101731 TaxID=3032199 RepID=UPI00255667C1|nr:CheR family methyltransferase [Kineosporia sp. NBRC 101731]